MSKGMHEAIALQMHISLAVLKNQPDVDAFDAIAGIINMVSLASRNDARFTNECLQLRSGIATMNQVSHKVTQGVAINHFDVACLEACITTIDQILSRMSVGDLYIANQALNQLKGVTHG